MQELKAYDVVIVDSWGIERDFEVTWFYHSMEEAQEHADEENKRPRHKVKILRERDLMK